MPTRPPIAHVVKHQLMFFWSNDWCVSTLRTLHSATPNQAMVDADRDVIVAWANASWRQRAGTRCALRQIKSWSLESVIPTAFEPRTLYPLTHVTGLQANDFLPRNVAACMSLRTGAVGALPKPPSGRLFHVGLTSASMTAADGAIDGAEVNALLAAYENLRTAFTGVGDVGVWVVVSYWQNGTRAAPVLRPGGPVALPITHMKLYPQWATVRRRNHRQPSFTVN